jgi:hypothetical protein
MSYPPPEFKLHPDPGLCSQAVMRALEAHLYASGVVAPSANFESIVHCVSRSLPADAGKGCGDEQH